LKILTTYSSLPTLTSTTWPISRRAARTSRSTRSTR